MRCFTQYFQECLLLHQKLYEIEAAREFRIHFTEKSSNWNGEFDYLISEKCFDFSVSSFFLQFSGKGILVRTSLWWTSPTFLSAELFSAENRTDLPIFWKHLRTHSQLKCWKSVQGLVTSKWWMLQCTTRLSTTYGLVASTLVWSGSSTLKTKISLVWRQYRLSENLR